MQIFNYITSNIWFYSTKDSVCSFWIEENIRLSSDIGNMCYEYDYFKSNKKYPEQQFREKVTKPAA